MSISNLMEETAVSLAEDLKVGVITKGRKSKQEQ
jgi:hypothetical protein